jgi:hypothetical protein
MATIQSGIRASTVARYRAIKDRFDHLFNEKRIRYDDVIKKLGQEFYISEHTVLRILKTDLPDAVLANGTKLKQGNLFENG